ncbi:similar to Saccharomyces cerevisiae YKL080W VMA5 Subunit C of the eight-subunit V1 peripheral membrane domain of vacuolar H+-ATPase (V- ATPase) [Maudiozyma barnettii]|uniref:V-type proton ATPase subunit C n=1 Tax=Maudiozyma barnettii TaxID=61262 RepID=A0A8H2ZJK5_9SACH|nr:H(+)-transporting V1 sector ATPase subunit C [Kazachstania barnettii]CAB4256083.1 similar to Saccharomyces cerevisiae YKL080W VMA5 Subunit C of the eight-subunit V1 peripheral membrane domain of vacuolar H+-ATPase (V- ATPase) [Kazachstania barnettii]CAD1784691.1 similar to Saccharomyces cerevisiae YKL080W VMA5 Subunit C of the eight-subunit V1 peripheral membrane domain of vacuolar H+-ATPase (V- ATPase) [Kazachstania barnettii]
MATTLYTANEFVLFSVPSSAKPISASGLNTDTWLQQQLLGGRAFVSKFEVPEFKIGSLDTLIVESEELNKIDNQVGASIGKIIEILSGLNEANTNEYKTIPINNVPVPEYLENFHWQTRKFKLDKDIKELISLISGESSQLDADVRATYTNYNNAKTNLAAAERKQTGDLSVRSLHDIVKPENFVLHSEHLTTILVAVPKVLKGKFEESYETLAKNVVPGSASVLSQDSEYILYNVHLFKKNLQEFISAAREQKFVPREFNYSEELIDELKKEHDSAASLEHSLRLQLVRLAKAAYVDVFMNWFHIKTLRVYVESVLRYGLPPHFNTKIIAVPPKMLNKCKTELIAAFGFLGGNAFAMDKNGKINKDDSNLHQYASLVDTEYEPFVMYSVTL